MHYECVTDRHTYGQSHNSGLYTLHLFLSVIIYYTLAHLKLNAILEYKHSSGNFNGLTNFVAERKTDILFS